MKVSVSLPDEDVAYVDRYAAEQGLTRSAALHQAIVSMRTRDLAGEYEAAIREWADSGEAEVWDVTIADGLG